MVTCEVSQAVKLAKTGKTAGIDFGLKTFLTVSDGSQIESPQFFRQGSQAIAKANRKVTRAQKGSGNRKKAVKQLARVHRTIARRREDWQWKEARKLTETFDTIWIEDLNLRGMKALASGPSRPRGPFEGLGQGPQGIGLSFLLVHPQA